MNIFHASLHSCIIFKSGMFLGWLVETGQPLQFKVMMIACALFGLLGLMSCYDDFKKEQS